MRFLRLALTNNIIIGLLFLAVSLFGCGFDDSKIEKKRYKYQAEFTNYVQEVFQDTSLLSKEYLLVLYANSCNACNGNVLNQIALVKNKHKLGVVFVLPPSDSTQEHIYNNFYSKIDTNKSIINYELNIGGSVFFYVEKGQMFNQTNLNEDTWKQLSSVYSL